MSLSNFAVEQTAGSHWLAAAAHRGRSADGGGRSSAPGSHGWGPSARQSRPGLVESETAVYKEGASIRSDTLGAPSRLGPPRHSAVNEERQVPKGQGNQPSNIALEQTAGSASLAAAAHRER